MIVTADQPVNRTVVCPVAPVRPPMPREHGAWGILLIPFATAVGVAGVWNLPVALLLVSILCFYVARASFLKQNYRWTVLLLAGSAVAAVPLLWVWKLWWLAVCGAIAAPLAFRKLKRNLAWQLLGVAGLTLTAPAAWYVATGRLDRQGWGIWLLNVLYFCGGIFYVKMHLAAAVQRASHKWRLGAPTLAYHGGLAVVAACTWPVGLALGPAVVRAAVGVARLTPRLQIKRLAWTEVAHSVVFAGLLIALGR